MSGNPFINKPNMATPQNNILQSMAMRNPNLLPILQLMQNGGNPQQVLQNMLRSNPQMQQVINQMKSSGLGAEQYVRNLARQYNIDIEPMIQSFKQRGFR